MLKKVFRYVFTICGMLFGYGVSTYLIDSVLPLWNIELVQTESVFVVGAFIIFFAIIFFNYYTQLQRRGVTAAENLESSLSKIPASEIAAGTVGLIAGLVIAFLISQIINGISFFRTFYLNVIISVILYLLLGYVGVSVGRRFSKEALKDFFGIFSNIRESARAKGKSFIAQPKIIDTSVIIDGRICDIINTGFIEGEIIIPEFVLVELRHLSDSADSQKRIRGRRGLDILNKIQTEYGIEIYDTSEEKSLRDIPEVDVKLLKLAVLMKGKLVTNDYNLNKVARIQGVDVLNINELASMLKPVVLPGELMQVSVIKQGTEPTQGIGYLDDGTMIVVEDGKKLIGKTVNATVTSVLQTSAGRMIFTKAQ